MAEELGYNITQLQDVSEQPNWPCDRTGKARGRAHTWGISQICMNTNKWYAKHENFLTPDLPHPAPQTWLLSPGGYFFFTKPPHMPVQNYQCDEGIILRYVRWVTRGPSPVAPPPLSPAPFRGPKCLRAGVKGCCTWAPPLLCAVVATRTTAFVSSSVQVSTTKVGLRLSLSPLLVLTVAAVVAAAAHRFLKGGKAEPLIAMYSATGEKSGPQEGMHCIAPSPHLPPSPHVPCFTRGHSVVESWWGCCWCGGC